MPDESTAATEHALLQEITAPLHRLPDDPLPIAADVDFPIVLRGYDRLAVDAYVKKTAQLVAELQATRSPEAAVRRAIERVGEEVSGVLQRAHETAGQLTAQSRSEAEERLELARREAAEIVAQAEQRLRDLDAETDRIWAERRRIIDDARELAAQLTSLAGEAAERFPGEESEEHQPVSQGDAPVGEEQPPATFRDDAPPAQPFDSEALDPAEAHEALDPAEAHEPHEAAEPHEPHPPTPVQAPATPAETPTVRISRGPGHTQEFE